MEEVLRVLREAAGNIDDAKELVVDQLKSPDEDRVFASILEQIDFASSQVRLAIGIAHRRINREPT